MSIRNYPYTNFHELNADWILEEMKKAIAEWSNTKEDWKNTREEFEELRKFVNDYFKNLDVQEEVNKKLDDMYKNGELERLISMLYLGYATPEMFGAVGDGVTSDTLALQNCIDFCIANKIKLFANKSKRYLTRQLNIASAIECDFANSTIIGNGSEKILNINTTERGVHICNLQIECADSTYAIYIEYLANSLIENVTIKELINTGIYINDGYEVLFNNIRILGGNSNVSVGIHAGSDSIFQNILMKNVHNAIYAYGNNNIFNNIHCWIISNNFDYADSSVMITCYGGSLFTNIYVDSYKTGFVFNSTRYMNIIDMVTFYYLEGQYTLDNYTDAPTMFRFTNFEASRQVNIGKLMFTGSKNFNPNIYFSNLNVNIIAPMPSLSMKSLFDDYAFTIGNSLLSRHSNALSITINDEVVTTGSIVCYNNFIRVSAVIQNPTGSWSSGVDFHVKSNVAIPRILSGYYPVHIGENLTTFTGVINSYLSMGSDGKLDIKFNNNKSYAGSYLFVQINIPLNVSSF